MLNYQRVDGIDNLSQLVPYQDSWHLLFLSLSVFVMGNCRDCHNEVHAKEATDRILRLLIVKVPFEEVAEP